MSVATILRHPTADRERPVPVLLVDDDPSKRLALKAILAPLGYHVVEADSGADGLRCLMAGDFAVILLDVRMPIMDGFETAALIRLRKQSEVTPIIFVTAHDPDEVMTDRYAEGAVDFITTPVHPDELRAKVSVFAKLFLQAQANAAKAQELQTSADQLTLLTETAPIGIFQTDAQNRYVYTNARWSEITGIPTAEAEGRGLAPDHRRRPTPRGRGCGHREHAGVGVLLTTRDEGPGQGLPDPDAELQGPARRVRRDHGLGRDPRRRHVRGPGRGSHGRGS